jgi:hypothetical protein
MSSSASSRRLKIAAPRAAPEGQENLGSTLSCLEDLLIAQRVALDEGGARTRALHSELSSSSTSADVLGEALAIARSRITELEAMVEHLSRAQTESLSASERALEDHRLSHEAQVRGLRAELREAGDRLAAEERRARGAHEEARGLRAKADEAQREAEAASEALEAAAEVARKRIDALERSVGEGVERLGREKERASQREREADDELERERERGRVQRQDWDGERERWREEAFGKERELFEAAERATRAERAASLEAHRAESLEKKIGLLRAENAALKASLTSSSAAAVAQPVTASRTVVHHIRSDADDEAIHLHRALLEESRKTNANLEQEVKMLRERLEIYQRASKKMVDELVERHALHIQEIEQQKKK